MCRRGTRVWGELLWAVWLWLTVGSGCAAAGAATAPLSLAHWVPLHSLIPFLYPLHAAWELAPALCCGCTIVLKASLSFRWLPVLD